MTYQFDSCSYGELTNCVRYRIKWLKGYRKIGEEGILKDYPDIMAGLRIKAAFERSEIKKLLKMRRILKKSDLHNWDSVVLNFA